VQDFVLLKKTYPKMACYMDQLITSKRIPHAIVLQGPAGVGKTTVCRAWAHQILGGFDTFDVMMDTLSEKHPLYHHINQGTHPEINILPYPTHIADIRKIICRLLQTSWNATHRIAIMPRVDHMNTTCMNALLKIVETPPPQTLFLMTASGPVMKTLLSRCLHIPMMPLTLDHIAKNMDIGCFSMTDPSDTLYLQEEDDNPWGHVNQNDLFSEMTQGCVGRAQTLKPVFGWIKKGWEFMSANAQAPSIPERKWIDSAADHMDLWKDMMYLWAHKATHSAYRAGKMYQWDKIWAESRQIINDYFLFHTNAALTVMTVCEKIGLFFRTHQLTPCHVTSQPPSITSMTNPT
jgi:hypothetical protein